jgi:hypothetical protein
MVSLSIGIVVVAVLAVTWGVATEFRQSRASGPVGLVPAYPFAVQAAVLVALGLFVSRYRIGWLPWWGCIGLGAAVGAVGIALIKLAGRLGRARRAA